MYCIGIKHFAVRYTYTRIWNIHCMYEYVRNTILGQLQNTEMFIDIHCVLAVLHVVVHFYSCKARWNSLLTIRVFFFSFFWRIYIDVVKNVAVVVTVTVVGFQNGIKTEAEITNNSKATNTMNKLNSIYYKKSLFYSYSYWELR